MLDRRKSETQWMEKLERGFQMGIDFALKTRYSHLSIFNDRPTVLKCFEIDDTEFERLDLERLDLEVYHPHMQYKRHLPNYKKERA